MNPLIVKLNLTPKWSNTDLRTNADQDMNDRLRKSIKQVSQVVNDKILTPSLCPLLERHSLQLKALQICPLVPLASALTEGGKKRGRH